MTLPDDFIDPEHTGRDRELLRTFYEACHADGGTADESTLRGIRAVLALAAADSPAAVAPAALAAEPLDPAGGGEALLAAATAPLEGEVGELGRLTRLLQLGSSVAGARLDSEQCRFAATLIKQQAAELAALRAGVVPVAVSDRPWEREAGWRDLHGECWWCPPEGPPYWSMVDPTMVYGGSVLPSHTIPLPAPQGGEVE